jgi:protoporphyrinogen oxidase
MPFNPKTNKWENTTGKLNKERTWVEKDYSKMSDEELLKQAKKDIKNHNKYKHNKNY